MPPPVTTPDCDFVWSELSRLKKSYPGLRVFSIGCTEEKRRIPCAAFGRGKATILYAAAFHSLEYITTLVLLRFLSDLLGAKAACRPLLSFDPCELFCRATFYLLPIVNPDGVNLVLNGFEPHNPLHEKIRAAFGEEVRARWQANIRGVDLNHNYDAGFMAGKALEPEYGVFGPGPTRYGGERPESEKETRSIVRLVKKICPDLVIALHTQGEEIYFDFNGRAPKKSKEIARIYSALTGYALGDVEQIASFRGFKDWFIEDFCRPGFTFELGRGKNPLPLSDLDEIYPKILEPLLLSPFLI